jgi:hypothetical protein
MPMARWFKVDWIRQLRRRKDRHCALRSPRMSASNDPAPSSPDFVLGAQPPAQPDGCVRVERPIRLAGSAYRKVVRPSAQHAVHFAHQRGGLLPCSRSVGQCVDFSDRALNAFLSWPVADTSLAGLRRKHSPERVSQEVELAFRRLADPCLLLVHRELQLAHDLAQALQGRFGFAPSAQDHEVIRIGYD